MPLSEKQADALGCVLWWPGLILGSMAGGWLILSGIVPAALLDKFPALGFLLIVSGAGAGWLIVALLVVAIQGSFRATPQQDAPPAPPQEGPRTVELPNVRHNRPPTPEDWGYRDHDDRD